MATKRLFDPGTCVRDMMDGIKAAYPSLLVDSSLGLTIVNEAQKLFDADSCVKDMLDGIKATYPTLLVNSSLGLTVFNEDRGDKVALLSGGGSGHEPFAAEIQRIVQHHDPTVSVPTFPGYVARNMLTGSVSGPVFASPPPANIFSCIQHLQKYNRGGVLVIIMNYTGDILNFGLAVENARAKGIKIETITISDDCALLKHKTHSRVGRRGISGCTFIFKILGAMSDAGSSLEDIVAEYSEIRPRLASMGVCLEPCTLPQSDNPLFQLGSDEMSLGLGVHGEPGTETIKICSFDELADKMIDALAETEVFKKGNSLSLVIGNLGSSTQMSCLIFAKILTKKLEEQGAVVERLYVGTVMSSLDMKGYQISVLNTTGKRKWLSYLDTETSAFGWPGTQLSASPVGRQPDLLPAPYYEDRPKFEGLKFNEGEMKLFQHCVICISFEIKKNMDKINELDSNCGDGDCGSTLARLAGGLLELKDSLPWHDLSATLSEMAKVAETTMGGSSGAIYSLLLQGAARSATSWGTAWNGGLDTLYKYSPARVGDRTMIDALAPACEKYNSFIMKNGSAQWKDALRQAILSAKEGCEKTRTLEARFGRASYCEPSRLTEVDPGAYGVVVWLTAISDVLEL